MNYTLHQLQVYLKVVQAKSITKASEELYLTQPAISIQLKNFQDQFDIPLIEIISRKVHVTEFGKEIAIAAEKILNEVYAINYKTMAYKGMLSGRLKLSIVSTAKYVMPYFLVDFFKKNNNVDLWMDVTNKTKVIESLSNNEVDFSLVSIMPDSLELESEILLDNKLYLVGNLQPKTKIINNKKLFFETAPLIYREEGSGTRNTMESFFEKNKITIRKKIELTSNEAVKQSVIAGMGYSIMPLIGLRNELLNHDVQIIPINGLPIKTQWRLIWLKNKKLSPVAQNFLDYIRNEKKQIQEKYFSWIQEFK